MNMVWMVLDWPSISQKVCFKLEYDFTLFFNIIIPGGHYTCVYCGHAWSVDLR
jgi:hypothetical protein